MGFFFKKKGFLAPKTKKFAGATVEFKGIPGIPTISFQSTLYSQNGPSTNISNLESRDRSTHEGETEQTNLPLWSRAKIRNIFGNTCECKLPVRQCTELAYDPKSPDLADWAELQRCNLQGVCTFLLPLALRRAAVLSDCIFPLCLLWVFEDTRTYDSKKPFSRQTEIHPEICENCRAPFCTTSVLLCFILLTSPFNLPQKKNSDKVDENLYQDMGLRYEKRL